MGRLFIYQKCLSTGNQTHSVFRLRANAKSVESFPLDVPKNVRPSEIKAPQTLSYYTTVTIARSANRRTKPILTPIPTDIQKASRFQDAQYQKIICSYNGIFSTRLQCRPPSNSAARNASAMAAASSFLIKRAGIEQTLASLCARASVAISGIQQRAALMPACLLILIYIPLALTQKAKTN